MAPKSTAIKPSQKNQAALVDARTAGNKENNDEMRVLRIYLDNGVVYEYDLPLSKVREHSAAIIKGGYRHNDGKTIFEHYPPHRIDKVQVAGLVPTTYPDRQLGT